MAGARVASPTPVSSEKTPTLPGGSWRKAPSVWRLRTACVPGQAVSPRTSNCNCRKVPSDMTINRMDQVGLRKTRYHVAVTMAIRSAPSCTSVTAQVSDDDGT
jgi:hypothetical protein